VFDLHQTDNIYKAVMGLEKIGTRIYNK
jgi:hypothetical protein